MERDSVSENYTKISKEDWLSKVSDILENEDGRTLDEKRAELIQYLQTRTDIPLAKKTIGDCVGG